MWSMYHSGLQDGSEAIAQLHRLILPFIMRRLKSEVSCLSSSARLYSSHQRELPILITARPNRYRNSRYDAARGEWSINGA